MEIPTKQKRQISECPFTEPQTGGHVWPGQRCPLFAPRTMALVADRQCWFCAYADFHLTQQVALEVGVCCWPKICID